MGHSGYAALRAAGYSHEKARSPHAALKNCKRLRMALAEDLAERERRAQQGSCRPSIGFTFRLTHFPGTGARISVMYAAAECKIAFIPHPLSWPRLLFGTFTYNSSARGRF